MAKKRVVRTVRVQELIDPKGRVYEENTDIPVGVEAELIKNGWGVRRTEYTRPEMMMVCDKCEYNAPDVPWADTAPRVYCSECV